MVQTDGTSFVRGIRLVFGAAFCCLFIGCGQGPSKKAELLDNSATSGIIGGRKAASGDEFPKIITALYDQMGKALCTASILNERTLVTAAHCVDGRIPKYLKVIFGINLQDPTVVLRQVQAFEVSPVWNIRKTQVKNTGDIAVVRFSGGLPTGFQAAEFLTDASKLTVGAPVFLAGYGASEVTLSPQGSEHSGAGILRIVDTTVKDLSFSVSEVVVEQSKGKGACHGDSGGPAYIVVNGKLLTFGVTSRGVDDILDTCSVSAAYTSIPFYWKWITQTAEKLAQPTSLQPIASLMPSLSRLSH